MPSGNLDLDTRQLSEFIYALNIARKQVAAYPPGHPMILSAAEKLLALKEKLLEFRPELTIGIARDTLLIDDKQLDPRNPVYRDLAVSLFGARVASLTVMAGSTVDDVRIFFEIMAYPTERISAAGGLSALLSSSGVRGFKAKEIDYRSFHATEVDSLSAPSISGVNEESAVLWKAFVGGVVSGTIDPDGVRHLPQVQLDPVLLAEILNREHQSGKEHVTESYEHAIAEFVKNSAGNQIDHRSRSELFDRMGTLIDKLSPELRRRMLNSTLQGLAATEDATGAMLANWSHATIVEAIELAETGQLQVPQLLLDILGKFDGGLSGTASQRQLSVPAQRDQRQTAELLSRLFHDGNIESYIPQDYSDALSVLAAADIATILDHGQIEGLLDNLNGHTLERQFCAITLELMAQDVENRSVDTITRNLDELIPYFLAAGDFQALSEIHIHLLRLREVPTPSFETAVHKSLDIFAGEIFTSQVLDGLDEWGKDQYPAIRELISRVGIPFVDPLLDRLAEEPLIARRRLYMECLKCIGLPACGFIVGRLSDTRWYVVRNLVILLREIDNPEILRPLGRLFTHPHPKVQYEVIRTCLHYNDPRANRYLLHELDKTDPGFLAGVVRLAAGSRSPEVGVKLAGLLNSRGNSEPELVLKGIVVSSLAEMGCVQALPMLAQFMESRTLFMSRALQRLKLEAIASLERFNSPDAADIAIRLQQKSSGEIAVAAERVLLKLQGAIS